MAKVPLPERGQPLDVTYIYQLAEALNDVSTQVSSANSKTTTIDSGTAGKQTVKTSEARVVGGYVEVPITTVTATQSAEFSYSYSDFKYIPIVTATPVNIKGTPAGQNVTVTLTDVSASKVSGIVRFNTAGEVSVGVNLIIIGIPV